jgi:NADH:ubiquinone oxidoreductase subunit E
MDTAKSRQLEEIYGQTFTQGESLIAVLQEVQNSLGYVDEESVAWLAKKSRISAATIFGVISFYSQFHLSPRGKNIITVCCGTVCHVKGADRVIDSLRQELRLKNGETTTKDRLFTLETVNCVGACSIAPVVTVGDKVYGKQTPDKMRKNLQL